MDFCDSQERCPGAVAMQNSELGRNAVGLLRRNAATEPWLARLS
jgi:hypothetical protein